LTESPEVSSWGQCRCLWTEPT